MAYVVMAYVVQVQTVVVLGIPTPAVYVKAYVAMAYVVMVQAVVVLAIPMPARVLVPWFPDPKAILRLTQSLVLAPSILIYSGHAV